MLSIEAGLAVLAVLIAIVRPMLGSSWFEKIELAFSPLSKRRALAVAVIGLSTLILRAAVLPVEHIPQPTVHDEFVIPASVRHLRPRPPDQPYSRDVGAL